MGMYDELISINMQQGGSWSHPIYARGGRHGGSLRSVLRTIGKKAKHTAKALVRGLKGDLTKSAVELGSDIFLAGKSPGIAVKNQFAKRGKDLAAKSAKIIIDSARGGAMVNQKLTQRSRSNQRKSKNPSREPII
jgi:hypothetical protein